MFRKEEGKVYCQLTSNEWAVQSEFFKRWINFSYIEFVDGDVVWLVVEKEKMVSGGYRIGMHLLTSALRLLEPRVDDDFVDRLHYLYTSTMFFLFSIIVSAKQYGNNFQILPYMHIFFFYLNYTIIVVVMMTIC